MAKKLAFTLLLLLSISGCGGKRKKLIQNQTDRPASGEIYSAVDIPTAQDTIRSFFDEDINEFIAEDMVNEVDKVAMASGETSSVDTMLSDSIDSFMWEDEDAKESSFKTVYFDWDSPRIRKDQEEVIAYNVTIAKQIIEEHESMGLPMPTFVIEGHSCHAGAAGNAYKLALSEKRAKALADRFISLGIPQEYVKVVGRGTEMPAIVDGKIVDGGRKEQWPNRRDEIRIIYA